MSIVEPDTCILRAMAVAIQHQEDRVMTRFGTVLDFGTIRRALRMEIDERIRMELVKDRHGFGRWSAARRDRELADRGIEGFPSINGIAVYALGPAFSLPDPGWRIVNPFFVGDAP